MRQKKASLAKKERLCGVKAVNELFSSGKSFNLPPVRVTYRIMPGNNLLPAARVLISVPKRHFRRAVDRNLIRRRIKEAYRKNKIPLVVSMTSTGRRIDMALIWTATEIYPYDLTERCIKEMIRRLSHIE